MLYVFVFCRDLIRYLPVLYLIALFISIIMLVCLLNKVLRK